MLKGEAVTEARIQSEWAEYQQIFNTQLERLSALLARHAKAEKKRLERLTEAAPEAFQRQPPTTPHALKAELRARAAAARGLGRFVSVLPNSRPPAPSEDD